MYNISNSTVGNVGPGGQVSITNMISSSSSSHYNNVKQDPGHLVTQTNNKDTQLGEFEEGERGQYLAILVFNQEYSNSSNYKELPGVEKDRIELTELLSEYQQIPIKNADNVLEDLKYIIEQRKGDKFERVHFHFSGHGVDNTKVDVDVENKKALQPHGECVVGTNCAGSFSSVHDITLELLKLDTEHITMTLDCCRSVIRGQNQSQVRGPVIKLHPKGDISLAEHEKLFIFKATRDTLPAHDDESFTRTLVSVCKEHGGALPILNIAKEVNRRRKDQKCEAIKVEDGNNWEKFYWPHDVRKPSLGPETGGETKSEGSTIASSVAVTEKETKSNTKESQPPSVSGSNHSITTVNTTVTGNNNSLSGGNVFGRDRSHRQDILNQPEPLFIVAFSVMLFAVFLALILLCLK